jgi:glucosamine--fructose-6-phosphate aminotransferase (isomerizing)
MCGIVGYIGPKKASEVILEALRKVEYRGYDSAGIAVSNSKIEIMKDAGKIAEIEKRNDFSSLQGTVGIGHTRWATHGEVNKQNAHPHTDCTGTICLVHNGIIENFAELRERLGKLGHKFKSETDTELVAHLLEENLKTAKGDFKKAFFDMLKDVEGSYSFVIFRQGERKIYGARKSCPLVIGIGKGEMFFASDMPAVLDRTREFVFLGEAEAAILSDGGYDVYDAAGKKTSRPSKHVDWTPQMAQKEGYPHFMLKEIFEQQATIRQSSAVDVNWAVNELKRAKNISIIACGTSYYAALVFKHLLASECGIRADAVIGSEFRSGVFDKGTCAIAISQSGETADTLSAVRFAKGKGARIIGITNVFGSSLTREADATVYIGAGPEIAVVATKSFTSQLVVLYKIALTLAGKKKELLQLHDLSGVAEAVLSKSGDVEKLVGELAKKKDFFFIGRGVYFPIALEGALKLKEIAYLHAEAYAAGELKHGPLSMLEDGVPIIAIGNFDENMVKLVTNVKECKARKARVLAVSDHLGLLAEADWKFAMPAVPGLFAPIIYILPLQLLAYYMAVKLGKDPDKPRNLAKSVTVE